MPRAPDPSSVPAFFGILTLRTPTAPPSTCAGPVARGCTEPSLDRASWNPSASSCPPLPASPPPAGPPAPICASSSSADSCTAPPPAARRACELSRLRSMLRPTLGRHREPLWAHNPRCSCEALHPFS